MSGLGTVRVRCGHCLRIYTTVTEHDYMSLPTARPPLRIARAAPWQEPPELPPEVLALFPPGTRILETRPGQGGRLKFYCHPTKCRQERVITFDNWTRKVAAALDAGQGELLIGRGGL